MKVEELISVLFELPPSLDIGLRHMIFMKFKILYYKTTLNMGIFVTYF